MFKHDCLDVSCFGCLISMCFIFLYFHLFSTTEDVSHERTLQKYNYYYYYCSEIQLLLLLLLSNTIIIIIIIAQKYNHYYYYCSEIQLLLLLLLRNTIIIIIIAQKYNYYYYYYCSEIQLLLLLLLRNTIIISTIIAEYIHGHLSCSKHTMQSHYQPPLQKLRKFSGSHGGTSMYQHQLVIHGQSIGEYFMGIYMYVFVCLSYWCIYLWTNSETARWLCVHCY